jgi:hypothetical protein
MVLPLSYFRQCTAAAFSRFRSQSLLFGSIPCTCALALGGEAEKAVLSVNPHDLDLGTVLEGTKSQITIPIENTTDRDIKIVHLNYSCGYCTKIDPPFLSIPAKGKRQIRLFFDFSRPACGTGIGSFDLRVLAHLPDGDDREPIEPWTFRGEVIPILSLEPGKVMVGRNSERAQPLKPVTVRAKAHVPLNGLKARFDNPNWQVTVTALAGRGSEYELRIAPKSTLPVATIDAHVLLTPIAADGTALPPKTVFVEGSVVSDIQSEPLSIFFGPRPIGQTAEEMVALESLTGRAFRVARVELPSQDVEAVSEPALRYRVRQRIARPMDQTSTIRFHVVTVDGAEAVVPLEVRYYGLAGK